VFRAIKITVPKEERGAQPSKEERARKIAVASQRA
jgi:hypothetical protein